MFTSPPEGILYLVYELSRIVVMASIGVGYSIGDEPSRSNRCNRSNKTNKTNKANKTNRGVCEVLPKIARSG